MPRRGSFQTFLNEREPGTTWGKGPLYLHIHKYLANLEIP